MLKINPRIFREYDIRGIVDKDIDEEFALVLGKAYGTYLKSQNTKDVVVARDTRITSEPYQKALMEGLISTGCNVFDLGIAIVSTMYFARQYYKIDGGVMVSASHNPPQYNGFKLCHGHNTLSGTEIQQARKLMEKGEFVNGAGKVTSYPQANKDYYKEIKRKITLKKKLKVVIDSSAAIAGLFVPDLLRDLGCEVVELYSELNPTNPPHIPDPVVIDAYKDLIKKVLDNNADVGVLFDGDADRVGFVDDKGRIQLGDIILTLLIQDYLPKNPGEKVIVELKDSEMVVDETNRLGGIPIFWKTGHSLLDKKVHEEKALLCGEMSCHYWITKDWYAFDDAVHTMCQVLRVLTEINKPLSQIIDTFPKYYATPEYRIGAADYIKFDLVKRVVEYFRPLCTKVIDLDGIRGYTSDGWFLFRASNTGPIVVLRVEAKSPDGLIRLKKFVEGGLKNFPEVHLDWNRQYDSH